MQVNSYQREIKFQLPSKTQNGNNNRHFLRRASDGLIQRIETLCGMWGYFVGRNALSAMLICFTLCSVFGVGLLKLDVIYRPYDLWVPKDSEFVKATNWISANFPPQYRKQVAIWESENILSASNIRKMWDFHLKVVSIKSYHNGRDYRWEDICLPFPLEYSTSLFDEASVTQKTICYETSLLELWGFNGTVIENLTDDDVIAAMNTNTVSIPYGGAQREFSSYLGGVERDLEGKIVGAQATLQTWYTLVDEDAILQGDFDMDVSSGEKVDKGGAYWEKALTEQVEQIYYNDTTINMRAGYTLSNALIMSILEDAKWIGIGWGLLILYVFLTLGLPFQEEHRVLPALIGLFAIAMAITSSFGICSFFDIPYGTLNNVLPVLLVALGVDDMYVIVTAWDAVKDPFKRNSYKRAQLTMERAGLAVSVTSSTNIFAFLVGTQTHLPGLRWFCIYSATGVFLVYVLQLTFFMAALVLNQNWHQSKGGDQLFMSKPSGNSHSWGVSNLVQRWGTTLPHKYVKVAVVIITISMFSFSSWNILHMSKEFDTMWLLPKSSSIYQWYESIAKLFPNEGENGFVYFKGIDFPYDVPELKVLAANITHCPYVSKVDAWFQNIDLDGYYLFMSDKMQCFQIMQNIDLRFLSHFKINLKSNNLFGDEEPCSSFLMQFQFEKLLTEEKRQSAMETVRALVRQADVQGHKEAWAHAFSYWETEKIIISELIQSLAMVIGVVGSISLVLLASLRASVLVLACVVGTLVDVASFVHMWGLTINTITSIAFVLAVGICVDYAAHIAHDFLKVQGTRNERAIQALNHIGSAVLHGGLSTLLAFLLLSPSGSYIFVSYFKILTAVSMFGLFHALVFLPVLLSLWGPEPYPVSEDPNEKHGLGSSSIFTEKIIQTEPGIRKSFSIYTINAGQSGLNDMCTKNARVSLLTNTHKRASSLPTYRIFPSEVQCKSPLIEENTCSTKL